MKSTHSPVLKKIPEYMNIFNIKSTSGHKMTPPSLVRSVCVCELEAASFHVIVVHAEQLTRGLYYVFVGSKLNSGLTLGFQC